ncbi:MAG: penicillin acylase family protein, partial [Acidimicrobiales bacterium]
MNGPRRRRRWAWVLVSVTAGALLTAAMVSATPAGLTGSRGTPQPSAVAGSTAGITGGGGTRGGAAPATSQDSSATAGTIPGGTEDYADGDAFSILPPGENGLVDPTQLAQYEANGTRPSNSQDQLSKYSDLIYGFNGLSDSQLGEYYDPESLDIAPSDVTRVEQPSTSVPVTIYRDQQDVPYVYGKTDQAAAFGVGYSQAEDRLFLMDVLRHYGQGTLSEFLGPSCAFEEMDNQELLLAPYTQTQAQAQLDALPHEYGAEGQFALTMIDSYVDGINTYIEKALADPSMIPGDYAAAVGPPQLWQPTDVVYIAALIGGIFGEGGGGQVQNAALLDYLEQQLGAQDGPSAFTEFKGQNDPAAPTTITDESFPYDIPSTSNPSLTAMPDDPSAALSGTPTDTTADCDLTKPDPVALADAISLLGMPRQMSNALVIGAQDSTSGHPLAVFGPQVGYYAPQILMEEDVHAPDYVAEGASFPGTALVELGRGEDFAWSATSAGTQNVNEVVEPICNPGGGAPALQGTYYLNDGKCTAMSEHDFSEVGVPKPGGLGAPAVIDHDIYWTVHGIVQGWTTVDGKPVAVVLDRTTYNHEVDSAVGFLRWANPAETYDVQSWMTGAEQINYTFNWFYVDDEDIGYYASGWD